MRSNRERMNYLHNQLINELNPEINRRGLGNKAIKKYNQVTNKKIQIVEISDDSWECMLPTEKEKKLVDYFICKRLEYESLINEMARNIDKKMIDRWLDSEWFKTMLTIVKYLPIVIDILDKISKNGKFFGELGNQKNQFSLLDWKDIYSELVKCVDSDIKESI